MKRSVESNIEGKRFQLLTVLYRDNDRLLPSGHKQEMWRCVCDCGKECSVAKQSIVSGRTKSCGCYRSKNDSRTKVALTRSGSVEEKYPQLCLEWNYDKNDKLPSEIPCGSDYKAWWTCIKCKNEWQTRVSHRVKDHGCPYCSIPPKKIKPGFNDLETYCSCHQMMYIIDEWDYNKNVINPKQIASMSNKKVYWRCPFGHSYLMTIGGRIGKKSQCPVCFKEEKTSFAEQAILFYLSKIWKDTVNRNNSAIGMELDIYIPSLKVAIEYDGHDWHRNAEEKEHKKNRCCKEKKIRLIRIREGNLPLYDDCECLVRKKYSSIESLNSIVISLLQMLGEENQSVDVIRDCGAIYQQYVFRKKEGSLENLFPGISAEWHPFKNGTLSPSTVYAFSSKKVWWRCEKGHEYYTSVNHRTKGGSGCPICINRKLLDGENDLLTYCKRRNLETILLDWDYCKNNEAGIDIRECFPGSIKRVWWKCSVCGNEWLNAINNRVKKGHMCPSCRRKKSPRSKRVINLDTEEVYSSIAEAAKAVNTVPQAIASVCKGIGKTARGYRWGFFDKGDQL